MPMGEIIQVAREPLELRAPAVVAAYMVRRRAGRLPPRTLTYVAGEWGAKLHARLDGEGFYDLTVVRPETRGPANRRVITWPETSIYAARPAATARDLLLLVGHEPNFHWQGYVDALATYLDGLGAKMLVTLRCFPGNVPHTRPAPVTMTAADPEMEAVFGLKRSGGRYQGPTDVGGVLAAKADSLGWTTVDLTVLQPHYFPRMPNAAASLALIGALDRAFGTVTPVDVYRARAESQARAIEEGVDGSPETRRALEELERLYDAAAAGEPAPPADGEEGSLPTSEELIEHIEQLFRGGGQSSEAD